MKAYLIDPATRTVEPVVFTGDYRNIYEHIGADCFCAVQLNSERDAVYLDDEGLFREGQNFFGLPGYPHPLAGRGLVLGCNAEGESTAPRLSLDQLRRAVIWLSGAEAIGMNRRAAAAMAAHAAITNADPGADHFAVVHAPLLVQGEDGHPRAE